MQNEILCVLLLLRHGRFIVVPCVPPLCLILIIAGRPRKHRPRKIVSQL